MKPLYEYGRDLLPLLEQYKAKGLISLRKHDEHDVYIASYTPPVVFDRLWDEVTLQTRCCAVDVNGLVAKTFDKFFNVGEVTFTSGTYHFTDKIDGSLILSFRYNGEILVSSKSTFSSEHAKEAKKLIRDVEPATYGTVFEFTHPLYRIVLDYGDSPRLYYLGDVDEPDQKFAKCVRDLSFLTPNESTVFFDTEQSVKDFANSLEGIEGFVLTDTTNTRKYKLKTPWYLSLHRMVGNYSDAALLDAARGDMQQYLELIPDYLRQDAANKIESYRQMYSDTINVVQERFASLSQLSTRKDFAVAVQQEAPSIRSALFLAYDGKDYQDRIWSMIAAGG